MRPGGGAVVDRAPPEWLHNFFHLGGHSLLATRLAAAGESGWDANCRCAGSSKPRCWGIWRAGWPAAPRRPTTPGALRPDPAAAQEPFPLTPVQEAYWLGRQRLVDLGEVACHVYAELRFPACGSATPDRGLAGGHRSPSHVARRDRPNGTQRIFAQAPPYVIAFADHRQAPAGEAEAAALAVRETMSHQVLPSDRWPLFQLRVTRLADQDWRLHLSLDALILDGESNNLLLDEIFDHYHGRARRAVGPEVAGGPTFRDYVRHIQSPSPAADRARAYWEARLDTLPAAPALPLAVDPSRLTDPRFGRLHAGLSAPAWTQLQRRAPPPG